MYHTFASDKPDLTLERITIKSAWSAASDWQSTEKTAVLIPPRRSVSNTRATHSHAHRALNAYMLPYLNTHRRYIYLVYTYLAHSWRSRSYFETHSQPTPNLLHLLLHNLNRTRPFWARTYCPVSLGGENCLLGNGIAVNGLLWCIRWR